MVSELYDETMEKMNQFINKVLQHTVNNTLLLSEYKIQDHDYVFDFLRKLNIECNKGEIQRGEIYYLLPKCYRDGMSLSLIQTYNNMVVLFYDHDKDRENVKEMLKKLLAMYIAASSFTFYQLMVRRFIEDGYSYVLTPDGLEGTILVAFRNSGIVVNDLGRVTVEELRIGPLAVWKFKLSDVKLPRYSFVHIIEDEKNVIRVEIEEITENVVVEVLIKLYDELKKTSEEVFRNNPALKKLIEEFLNPTSP